MEENNIDLKKDKQYIEAIDMVSHYFDKLLESLSSEEAEEKFKSYIKKKRYSSS
ncbi:hypothetical protein ACFIJ5_17960 (plasmid) [Haloimpatiens sp. FM7330]|uniref:hypothetical protein n=1 Tax=Haloimpatiens sp. FM7330 TaxID=3298610 RepID=UPI00363D6A81